MTDEAPDSVAFSFIKSRHFRVIHVDGAIGSITPRGLIHVAVYSERPAIPQLIVQRIENGALGAAETVESRGGIVREVDADLMLTPDAARGLRDWLDERLLEWDQLTAGGKDA